MMYDLPTSVEVNGIDYKVRTDYRAVLDICTALSDYNLDNDERVIVCLDIFYEDFESIPISDYSEALEKCFWFINLGEEVDPNKPQKPTLVNWEQDFQYIVAPINRVAGREIRADAYMHWWTFVAYYNEIGGDCTFAQIVRIRHELKKYGRIKDKADKKWYEEHRDLVDMKVQLSDKEQEVLNMWMGVNKDG